MLRVPAVDVVRVWTLMRANAAPVSPLLIILITRSHPLIRLCRDSSRSPGGRYGAARVSSPPNWPQPWTKCAPISIDHGEGDCAVVAGRIDEAVPVVAEVDGPDRD